MDSTDWLIILQALSTLGIVATYFVFWYQLVAMRGMLEVARETSRHENLVTLINLLQTPDAMHARLTTIKLGRAGRSHDQWTDDEVVSVERVCNAFNLTAILIRHQVVPESPILDQWGDSILKCWEAVEGFVAYVRPVRGHDHWTSFEWLAGRARAQRAAAVPADVT